MDANEPRVMTTRELESERRELQERLNEIDRLLSAGQLAYHLQNIRQQLRGGSADKALAEFDGVTLSTLMKLHGY